MSKQT